MRIRRLYEDIHTPKNSKYWYYDIIEFYDDDSFRSVRSDDEELFNFNWNDYDWDKPDSKQDLYLYSGFLKYLQIKYKSNTFKLTKVKL